MPFVTARDGHRIHYREIGEEGPWVVMIQGLSLSGRFWFDAPQRVAERGARVLWIDNRGTGQSDRARRLYSMRTLAADVLTMMDDAGADRATVVGISMGGMIAQQLAVQHPERVEALVLLATTPGLPHGHLPALRTLLDFARLPFARGRAASAVAARLLLPPAERHRWDELFARWPEAFLADPQHAPTFFHQLGAVALHSVGRHLGRVTVPTIVVTGSHDVLVDPRNSQVIARLLPGAELEVLEGVGHAIPAQDPEVVLRALERVWAKLGARPRSTALG